METIRNKFVTVWPTVDDFIKDMNWDNLGFSSTDKPNFTDDVTAMFFHKELYNFFKRWFIFRLCRYERNEFVGLFASIYWNSYPQLYYHHQILMDKDLGKSIRDPKLRGSDVTQKETYNDVTNESSIEGVSGNTNSGLNNQNWLTAPTNEDTIMNKEFEKKEGNDKKTGNIENTSAHLNLAYNIMQLNHVSFRLRLEEFAQLFNELFIVFY